MNVQDAARELYHFLHVPNGSVNTLGILDKKGHPYIRVMIDYSMVRSVTVPHLFHGYPVKLEKTPQTEALLLRPHSCN